MTFKSPFYSFTFLLLNYVRTPYQRRHRPQYAEHTSPVRSLFPANIVRNAQHLRHVRHRRHLRRTRRGSRRHWLSPSCSSSSTSCASATSRALNACAQQWCSRCCAVLSSSCPASSCCRRCSATAASGSRSPSPNCSLRRASRRMRRCGDSLGAPPKDTTSAQLVSVLSS